MADNIAHQIHRFIQERFPEVAITRDDDIFAMGFINSLFAMELVMFIEKTFEITVPNEDLKFDNFRTVASMTALVARQPAATVPEPGPR